MKSSELEYVDLLTKLLEEGGVYPADRGFTEEEQEAIMRAAASAAASVANVFLEDDKKDK